MFEEFDLVLGLVEGAAELVFSLDPKPQEGEQPVADAAQAQTLPANQTTSDLQIVKRD